MKLKGSLYSKNGLSSISAPDRDLVTSRLVDSRRSRPRLAMLAFHFVQTRIRLRLSSPDAHKAVYALWA